MLSRRSIGVVPYCCYSLHRSDAFPYLYDNSVYIEKIPLVKWKEDWLFCMKVTWNGFIDLINLKNNSNLSVAKGDMDQGRKTMKVV
jgi:hypothetical protein